MSDRTDHLSPREREILSLAGDGMSSKEIARRLAISPRTVDAHIAHAIATLGAKNRLEAALAVKQAGLVDLPREPRSLAATPLAVSPSLPDRSVSTRWWKRLPILRNGRLNNDLTIVERLGWILAGALAIIVIFAQLAAGLKVAQEIALGLPH